MVLLLCFSGSLLGEEVEKSYQLAEKDWESPVGVRVKVKTSREVLNGKLKTTTDGAWTTGRISSLEESEIIGVRSSDDSYVLRFEKETSRYRTVYEGNKSSQRKDLPFHEKTVQVDREDGGWRAKVVEGDLDEVDPDELERRYKLLTDNLHFDYAETLYGTEPRKVGESWEIKLPRIPGMGRAKVEEGKATLIFEEVKEMHGHECAVLKLKFSVKMDYSKIDGGTLFYEGEGTVVRSLKTFFDFKSETKGFLKSKREWDDFVVETEGKCKMLSEIVILPPVEKE